MNRSKYHTIRNRVFFSIRYSARRQTECVFAIFYNLARILNTISSCSRTDAYEGDIQPVWPRSGRGIPHRETIRTRISTLCSALRSSWHRTIQLAILLGRAPDPWVHFFFTKIWKESVCTVYICTYLHVITYSQVITLYCSVNKNIPRKSCQQ
jgi:hypothetical protein